MPLKPTEAAKLFNPSRDCSSSAVTIARPSAVDKPMHNPIYEINFPIYFVNPVRF